MLKIPEGVPKELVEELQGYQDQIYILLSNYKILKDRLAKALEDTIITGQIKQVRKYLFQFNRKQAPVIKKIRAHIKTLNTKSSDEDSSPKVVQDEDKVRSEEDILESLGIKDAPRMANGKVDHAKLNMKDRMAIVRGMRKRKRGSQSGNAAKKRRTPSPKIKDEVVNKTDDIPKSQYKGHISEYEKVSVDPPDPIANGPLDVNDVMTKVETYLESCNKTQFLHNLGLFTQNDVDLIKESMDKDAKVRITYRNMTYVPELTDKKHKQTYNYLAPDLSSPPLLRTRQRRPPQTMPGFYGNGYSRTNSRSTSNSRATTPDKTGETDNSDSSRSKSGDSDQGKKVQKKALEIELVGLQQRATEMQNVIGANKRTIATRKEKSRLTEVTYELKKLESRINQVKKMLANLK